MLDLYERDKTGVLELNVEPGYSGPTPLASRPDRNFTTINAVLYYPFSRGRTHIVSNHPGTPPLPDPNYWAHPLDVAGHVAGMQLSRRQLRSKPLGSIFQAEFEPGMDIGLTTTLVLNSGLEVWLRVIITRLGRCR
ncbi:mala s 12 allergen [Coprinopsis cinerea AmutBmut pab1-1]|nr:mala s 12 allergen [Coprinopsis cinerea AmutBmut pab1-1]